MDRDLTPVQEAALLRNLRDIGDGHLTLWINPDDYDLAEGPLAPQLRVYPDRSPAIGTPAGSWWELLVWQGWVAPHVVAGRPYYRITDAGRRAVNEGNDGQP